VVIGAIAIIAKGEGTTVIVVIRSTVTETVVDADFESHRGARVNTAPVLGHRAFDEGGDAWLRGPQRAPKRAIFKKGICDIDRSATVNAWSANETLLLSSLDPLLR
jgi:hypothetical protein